MTDPRWEAYRGTRALVTGGAGAIGGRLVRRLRAVGCATVTVLDDFSSAYEWNAPAGEGVRLVRGDILDPVALAEAFDPAPHFVFHLAAFFANQNSVEHPERNLEVNGLGTLRVLEAARGAAPKRVIVASSGCGTYGPATPMPFREESVSLRMGTPYQITKLLGEMYGLYFHDHFGLPVAVARLFNVFGPGEVPGRYRNVIPNFLYWAMAGRPLPVYGTGDETRDWTFVEDTLDGLLAMGLREGAVGEAINLASGRSTTVREMAEEVNRLTGNAGGIELLPRRDWDTKPHLLASIDKAAEILDYQPATRFADGVAAVHEWFSANWNHILESAAFQRSCR